MNIEIKELDDILIAIEGRVDTNSVSQLEDTLLSFVDKNTEVSYKIDLDKLDYISSAGLRFFLKLRKRNIDFEIINASPDVYEIFDMTGFTKIIDVSKRIREVSIEGCTVIGRGANGVVYRLDDETILKLYNDKNSLEHVKEERRNAENALLAGIPTAISFDIVKSGDRYGTVFELLDSKSLADVINEEPEKLQENVNEYIALLKEIHAINKNQIMELELSGAKAKFDSWIEYISPGLNASIVSRLKEFAESIQESESVIHGDSQPNNVMVTRDGFLFIDMDTLSYGNPIFEMAYLYSTLIGYNEVIGNNRFVGMSHELCSDFWNRAFVGYYNGETEDTLTELRRRCEIISAVQVYRNMVKHREKRGEEAFLRSRERLYSFF